MLDAKRFASNALKAASSPILGSVYTTAGSSVEAKL